MTQIAESQKAFREALKAEVFAMVTEKEETANKEKEELAWEAKAKEQAEEIAQLRAQAAGGVAGGAGG